MLNVTHSPLDAWRTIDLKERGSLELLLRKPSWERICEDARQEAGYREKRLRSAIIDWRGIEINGEVADFSWDNFVSVCEQVPIIFHHACALVSDLYYSLGEDAEKNSEEASSGS